MIGSGSKTKCRNSVSLPVGGKFVPVCGAFQKCFNFSVVKVNNSSKIKNERCEKQIRVSQL